MADASSSRPQVNGILETSIYVEHPPDRLSSIAAFSASS
jgi:hypothetical protein